MTYIDRDAAIMTAMDYDGNGNAQDASQDIASAIGDIPAADVVPVVHGRWLGKDYYNDDRPVPYDPNAHGQWGCFCSECGLESLLNGNEQDVPSNYCPNCGAKMDGGDKE